jgi:choline dehydrogenase-like flavoprotein
VATGNCQIRPLCMAHQIELDARGRATAVRFFDGQGQEQRLKAAVIVLACAPLESARLLLLSKSPSHPSGLGNEQGLVGRNLMFMGYGAGNAEFSRSDSRIAAIDFRQPFVHRSFQDFYFIEGDSSARRKGGTLNYLLPHANPIATCERLLQGRSLPIWGKALKETLRYYYHRMRELEFEVFSETLPTAETRVELDPTIKDRWGIPAARLVEQPHPLDLETNRFLVQRGLDVLTAMGGRKVTTTRLGQGTTWLQAGTCRFGADPRTSVLDRDCRLHQVPNLFVTDGSFMPTSGGVPNTLTVEANALRVADRIVALGKELRLRGG